MSKHTKESWNLRRNNHTQVVGIDTPDGWYPLFSDKGNNRNGYNDIHFANARTMVAAPDLLEACKEVRRLLWNDRRNFTPKDHKIMDILTAAINRAEGRE